MGETASQTAWFSHDRFGMFVHFGAYSVAARHEWVQTRELLSAESYRTYVDHFNPDLFDARALARAAVESGCRYIVLTAKHHDGFCLWNSALTDYSTAATIGRDLVREYVDAVREAGLKVGLYYSLIDWHHPDFIVDSYHPDRKRDVAALNAGRDMARYRSYLHGQVRELLTDYGQIDLLFYDFTYPEPGEDGLAGKGPDSWDAETLLAETRRLQPGILVNNRLGIPGDYTTPEQFQPTQKRGADAQVWEACQTLNGSWGYDRDNLDYKDPLLLITMLIRSVALGGNMILNVGPNARGNIAPRDQQALAAIGDWMRLHEAAIIGCGAAELSPPSHGVYTQGDGRLYLHVLAWPLQYLHLPDLAGQIAFARFLHDGSEVTVRQTSHTLEAGHLAPDAPPSGAATLVLPIARPEVAVPVIELTLRSPAGG